MVNFKCEKCGSQRLAYQNYFKCVIAVEILEDGTIYYARSTINEDSTLGVEGHFCCADCGHPIYHCADPIRTESELQYYLSLSEVEQRRQNDAYLAKITEELDYEDEQRREFDELISQITEE